MKVLLVHNYYREPGGEDTVFNAERLVLLENNHEVIEYTDRNDRIPDMSALNAVGRTVWSLSSRNTIQELIKENNPDIAHFHNTFFMISPSVYGACQELNVPVVQTLHNYRLICPAATLFRRGRICEKCIGKFVPWPGVYHGCWRESRLQTAAIASMLSLHNVLQTWIEKIDIFITLTGFARKKFIAGGLPEDKLFIKPNFVIKDPLRELPEAPRREENYAIFVGRLSPEKGVYNLLEAWQELRHIPLKILGDGPNRIDLERFVNDQNLTNVEFFGRQSREAVYQMMRSAAFLVFPSLLYEGFPLSILEAFACGIPVISSNIGAMTEMVTDQTTGLLYRAEDPSDLAKKVNWAWGNAPKMASFGEEARREYELKFTADRNYEILSNIYQRAIAAKTK